MSLRFGIREADIAQRENGIISWLGTNEHMAGGEIFGLFSEGVSDTFSYSTRMITQLALDSLVERGVVESQTVLQGGVGFQVFNLADRAAADSVDPATVELTPREIALMCTIDTRRYQAQTADELNTRLRLGNANPLRTEACLTHLAKIGLLNAVESPAGAYLIAQPK